MLLVVGLGNPSQKAARAYEGNRHNVGFVVADAIQRAEGFPEFREKFSGVWTKGRIAGVEATLLKPATFMNLSGDSVQPAAAFLKVAPSDIVVVHDELDIPFGEVRLKSGGGHAGHNGLRSIIGRLGTPDFVRVRVGIGRPPPGFHGDIADYVLGDFDASERADLPAVIERARDAVARVAKDGLAQAMNAINVARKRAQT